VLKLAHFPALQIFGILPAIDNHRQEPDLVISKGSATNPIPGLIPIHCKAAEGQTGSMGNYEGRSIP